MPGTDNLPGFSQRIHDHSVGVGQQHGVASRILCHIRLCLCSTEFRFGRIGCGLYLTVGRCRHSPRSDQTAVTRLVISSLSCTGPCRRDGLLLSLCLQAQVNRIQTHQWLAAFNGLAGIDQTFKDFALHSKTEVTLSSGYDNAGKCAGSIDSTRHGRRPYQRRLSTGIFGAGRVTAGHKGKRQQANSKSGRIKPEHGFP
ncbi:hypothetical protein D3C78_824150 [compost metagenome]